MIYLSLNSKNPLNYMSATTGVFFWCFYALNFERLWTLETTFFFFFGWMRWISSTHLPSCTLWFWHGWLENGPFCWCIFWVDLCGSCIGILVFTKGKCSRNTSANALSENEHHHFVSMSQQWSPGQRNLLQPARPDMISSVLFSSSPNKQFIKHGMSKQHWWL